tara:strand:+ start:920 stop:1246 length:327 start_codon:yes stop_codon:yes gene_type:complete
MEILNSAYASSHVSQEPSALGFLLPIFILILMYFILIRPQSKKLKEHKAMIKDLNIGDEVSTNGGIYGKITKIGESFVLLKINDNVEIKLQKNSVSQILPKNTLEKIK